MGIARQATAVTAAIVLPLSFAMRTFSTFEESMSNLRAAANPTAEEMERINGAITQLSKSLRVVSTSEVADVFTELLKAGMSLETVLNGGAEAAIKFARVGKLDVATAATVMNDALNVFSKQGLTAAQAVDILSKAADASSISIEQIAQAFSMSSAVFGNAELTMNDLASAIGIMGNAGVKGSDAGTSLKTMLLRLQTGAGTAATVMKQLGLNFRDANGNMLPMRGIIKELQRAFAGLSAEARDRAMLDLFGTDAIRAGAILLKTGVKGWDEFNAKMGESLSVGQKFSEIIDNLGGDTDAFFASLQRLQTSIGKVLVNDTRNLVAEFTKMIEGISGWIDKNHELVSSIASTTGKLLLFGNALVWIVPWFEAAAVAAEKMVDAMMVLAGLQGIIPSIKPAVDKSPADQADGAKQALEGQAQATDKARAAWQRLQQVQGRPARNPLMESGEGAEDAKQTWDNFREAVQDARIEIGLLTGAVTKNQVEIQKMIAAGIPPRLAAQYKRLLDMRDQLEERTKRKEGFRDEARQIAEDVRTPFEKFREELQRIARLRTEVPKDFSRETAQRARQQAADEFAREVQAGVKRPDASHVPAVLHGLEKGTVAAAEAAARNREGEFLSQLVDLQRENNEELRRAREAIERAGLDANFEGV